MSRTWTRAHVERLLWRAGFGGRPGEIDFWARRSQAELVHWLLKGGRGPHGTRTLVGPAPHVAGGRPLDPHGTWGHDALWWLDRMVRSQRPLQEKLTLFWHDHFATRDQSTRMMLAQNRTLCRLSLGSFDALLAAMTTDPALARFLSLADSDREAPNENFAREMMELFTLGSGAYSERDVREGARALTGFVSKRLSGDDWDVVYDGDRHDPGRKTYLGQTGALDWRDVLRIVTAQPAHAPFLTAKLWAFFVSEPLDAATARRLQRVYVGSEHSVAAVVEAILTHPKLYADLRRPSMVKWPAVHVAGLLKQVGRGIDVEDWAWITQAMGQELFRPPSVAGWDGGVAWLSTQTMHARFLAATYIADHQPVAVAKRLIPARWNARQHVAAARRAVGRPQTTPSTDRHLICLAGELMRIKYSQPEVVQSALRHLLLSGPDAQLC